jgi:uncharacterized protein
VRSASPLSTLALLAMLAAPAGAVEVADLTRPAGGLLDRTGRMSRESTAEFRRIAEHVRRETGGEIVAVVVESLEGKEPSPFARELSESWRLGGDDAKGLLIFVALSDRQVELTLGRGLDDPERRRRAAEIVRDTLAPRLRAGDLGGALVAAARESATRIFYAVEVVAPEAGEERAADPSPDSAPAPPEIPAPAARPFAWVPYAIGLAILLLGLAIYGALKSDRN